MAERIAEAVLAEHGRVEAIGVRVTKPHVRLDGGALAGATVEIIRRRASVST